MIGRQFLSQAEKEILFKVVVQAIPTYSMSIFMLPKSLCKEINAIMQRFWWGHKDKENKIHWISWARLGRSKAEGGLGFIDLICFNTDLLVKQCWRLIQNPNGLAAKIIRAKYFPHESFYESKIGNIPSYAWRSLLSAKDLMREGVIWRIGDRTQVKIWGDCWVP